MLIQIRELNTAFAGVTGSIAQVSTGMQTLETDAAQRQAALERANGVANELQQRQDRITAALTDAVRQIRDDIPFWQTGQQQRYAATRTGGCSLQC